MNDKDCEGVGNGIDKMADGGEHYATHRSNVCENGVQLVQDESVDVGDGSAEQIARGIQIAQKKIRSRVPL